MATPNIFRCPICLGVVVEEDAVALCPLCAGKPAEAGGWRDVMPKVTDRINDEADLEGCRTVATELVERLRHQDRELSVIMRDLDHACPRKPHEHTTTRLAKIARDPALAKLDATATFLARRVDELTRRLTGVNIERKVIAARLGFVECQTCNGVGFRVAWEWCSACNGLAYVEDIRTPDTEPACSLCAKHYGDDGVCDQGKPVASPHRPRS